MIKKTLLLLLVVLLDPKVVTAQRIATWPDGCKTAVTFTFEDATGQESHQWAVEQLDQYGFKASFYVVTNWNPSWEWCKSVAQNGHEIGSHSDSHPNNCEGEEASSKKHIEDKVGQPCLTMAYPNCNVPKDESAMSHNYIGGRICNGSWVGISDIMGKDGPSNWYKIPCNLCGSVCSIRSINDFTNKCKEAIDINGWVVFGLTAIEGLNNGSATYSPTKQEAFTGTLLWLDQNRKDYWVATLRDVIMYVKERNATLLQKTTSDNYSQTWKLTHTLDQTLCNWDYPLSIEIPLPEGWTTVTVKQGYKKIEAEVRNGNVYFKAVPNGGYIILQHGVKGDVNVDGVIDVADIAAVIDVMTGKGDSDTKVAADVNGDTSVDVADIAAVIDIMAGKISIPQAPTGAKGIDLGLPSGTLWANMNVGAEAQNEYGLYFAWGETKGYSSPDEGRTFNWGFYKWMAEGKSSWMNITKYTYADGNIDGDWYNTDFEFIGDGKTILDLDDDAAHANWGGQWCIPTAEHIQELLDNTDAERFTLKGVNGYKFTSKVNGNTIFLPAAGCIFGNKLMRVGTYGEYSSSSLDTSYGSYAANIILFHDDSCEKTNLNRYIATSIRPIIKGTKPFAEK